MFFLDLLDGVINLLRLEWDVLLLFALWVVVFGMAIYAHTKVFIVYLTVFGLIYMIIKTIIKL